MKKRLLEYIWQSLFLTKTKLKDKKENLSFIREDIQTLFVQEYNFPTGKAKLTLFGRADKVIRKKRNFDSF